MVYHRPFTEFGKLPKMGGGFALRNESKAADYIVTVDPVNGSDAPDNDGTVTPLKTLPALFERLPARCNGKDWDAATKLLIRLKAGHHVVPAATPGSSYMLALVPGYITFEGEWSAPLASFTLDHFSGDSVRVHQPAGNPAWTVDAWAGKWAKMVIPYWGTLYLPILGNGTHDLIGGWVFNASAGGPGFYPPPALGSTIEIVEHATIIDGPGLFNLGVDPMTTAFSYVRIDGSTFPWASFYITGGQTYFGSCHIFGNSGWYPPTQVNTPFYLGALTHTAFRDCLFEQVYGGMTGWNCVVELFNCSVINSLRLIEAEHLDVLVSNCLHVRNGGDILRPGTNSKLIFDTYHHFHFINPMGGGWTGALVDGSRGQGIDVQFFGNSINLDGEAPGFYVAGYNFGCIRFPKTWTCEARNLSGSFRLTINGVDHDWSTANIIAADGVDYNGKLAAIPV